MPKYLTNLLLVVFIILLNSGCAKVSNEPFFDLTPRIELLGVEKDTVTQFSDSISIAILYEDGDGDLGNPDPDVNSIFVKDSRLEKADEYYLGPLAPEGAKISIHGTLNLRISPTFLLGNGTVETMTLSIYVVDRSGNQSNTIVTETITILKD